MRKRDIRFLLINNGILVNMDYSTPQNFQCESIKELLCISDFIKFYLFILLLIRYSLFCLKIKCALHGIIFVCPLRCATAYRLRNAGSATALSRYEQIGRETGLMNILMNICDFFLEMIQFLIFIPHGFHILYTYEKSV